MKNKNATEIWLYFWISKKYIIISEVYSMKEFKLEKSHASNVIKSIRFSEELNEKICKVVEQANKGKAVKHICKYLGVTMKDAVCFGDSFNDRDMLIRSGWGVAMANAPLEIKIIADDVTELKDVDGGVADYIRKNFIDNN